MMAKQLRQWQLYEDTQGTSNSTSWVMFLLWRLTDFISSPPSLKLAQKSLHYTVENSVTVDKTHLKTVLSKDF